ncbi:MAG: ATP-binding protein [Verrucomicrobiales bacterium]|nr:ATP-binding protein [Verrucomicrobiales bacterium]
MPLRDQTKPRIFRSFFQKQLSSPAPPPSKFERLRYVAEDSKVTVSNVALGAKWAAVLVMLFSVVDFLIYPEYASLFFLLRVVCCALVLSIARLCKNNWARRQYRLFAMLVQLTVAVFMALMIYLLEEPGTTYYAGLNLCIVGTATVVQLTLRETVIACAMIFTMFVVATIPGMENILSLDSFRLVVGDCFFLIATAILVVMVAYNQNNFRYGEFVARTRLRNHQSELEQRNQELKVAMQNLQATEKQLFQSEKMALLGQLSAGVIHEIANPLNFTNNALFVLGKKLGDRGEDVREVIDDMQEGIDRIRDIVTDLREFSHTGGDVGEALSVMEVVQSSIRLLKKPIEESGAEVSVSVDRQLNIIGVKNQLVQVFSNLIHNAIQAMETVDGERLLSIAAKERGDGNTVITISDTGSGISDEDKEKLFDLFFTTKPPGMGTGLGLSISFRIIEAHNGIIEVESEPGKGTAFSVVVPSVKP